MRNLRDSLQDRYERLKQSVGVSGDEDGEESQNEEERHILHTEGMLQDTEARIKELKGDAEQCAGRLFSLSQELQKTVMELSRKEAERNALLHMENTYEGYSGAVRFLMKEAKIDGIFGTVGELIEVPSGYEIAVKISFGRAYAKYHLQRRRQRRSGCPPAQAEKGRTSDVSSRQQSAGFSPQIRGGIVSGKRLSCCGISMCHDSSSLCQGGGISAVRRSHRGYAGQCVPYRSQIQRMPLCHAGRRDCQSGGAITGGSYRKIPEELLTGKNGLQKSKKKSVFTVQKKRIRSI